MRVPVPTQGNDGYLGAMVHENAQTSWSFYGREAEIAALSEILDARRFFFLRVSGRRRIGKTTLVLHTLRRSLRERIAYIQVPDADPAGHSGRSCAPAPFGRAGR